MAHYAFLDENNIVTEVITGRNEDEVVEGISDWETYYGSLRNQRCLRTSYNGNYRKNFAVIGGVYNESLDAFISPTPYPSWILDTATCTWQPPKSKPASGNYRWDEASVNWVAV